MNKSWAAKIFWWSSNIGRHFKITLPNLINSGGFYFDDLQIQWILDGTFFWCTTIFKYITDYVITNMRDERCKGKLKGRKRAKLVTFFLTIILVPGLEKTSEGVWSRLFHRYERRLYSPNNCEVWRHSKFPAWDMLLKF